MSTVLLIVIYIAFIGLGVPDSLFGTAWPAIYGDFNLPISFGSFVTVIASCGTTVSSLVSSRLISRFGTNKVTAVSTLATALSLLLFAVSDNYIYMCFLAIPLGLGAGAVDVALNNYVAIHYSATQMSFLHCFYGIGVSVSPYVLSLVINGSYGWRGGYKIAFLIQIAITVLLFATLPLWKRAHAPLTVNSEECEKSLSLSQTLKISGVKLMCLMFITSCAIEWTCGSYGTTFLVEYKNIAKDVAATYLMVYYIGITIGRFLSGVVATKLHSWKIVKIGICILGVAMAVLLLPLPNIFSAVGVFLIGLGNGPIFPNLNYLAPETFGKDVSQSVIGVQMASAYIGIMLAPALCGILGQFFGMGIFPYYLAAFYLIMLFAANRVGKIRAK